MPATTTAQVVGGSTRWCPTPEQLMILEEMYRGGLRTPNASQIQQITAHLALYGRIEGKNVFYWFQNHKARDRQKLRRRLCMSHHLLSCAHYYAAAAAGHHQLLGVTGAIAGAGAASAPGMAQQYYSCGAGLDQQSHLFTTTPIPAAGYGAGYCYPFGAAPPSRCAGTTPAPPNPLSFQYQQGGGLPEYSLGRLGNLGVVEDTSCAAMSTVPSLGYEQLAAMEAAAPPSPAMGFCRPLKTLDLFPGAIKEEQRDVV